MKKDMRVSYPLWQMGSIIILMILVLTIGYSSTFTVFDEGGFEFQANIENGLGVVFSFTLLLLVFYMSLFSWKVFKHNRRLPESKINMLSIKPQEYMEDDELFEEITKRATKKVYSYYTWALPVLAGLYIGVPVGRTWMIFGILLVAAGQYLIYYKAIRKYVTEDE